MTVDEVLEDRECTELLICPACKMADVDFELLAYRLVMCSFCRASVRVTHYKVSLGEPGDPHDWVEYVGELAATSTA